MESVKAELKNRRILVIDDKESIHDDFRQILSEDAGSEALSAARAAVFGPDETAKRTDFEVDCVFDGHKGLSRILEAEKQGRPYAMAFVDLRLESDWDGIETIEHLWQIQPNLQVVICTAYSDYSWNDIANRLGTTERLLIIKKPFDNIEVRQTAFSLTEKWELLNNLDALVKQRTAQVTATRDVAMFVIASLAESGDNETGEHLERIRGYCHILAEQLKISGPYTEFVDDNFIDELYRSSPLHDIGKIGIPDAVLLKPGVLSEQEFEIIKKHVLIGSEVLSRTLQAAGDAGFLSMAADIARYHHERFDGSGYPDGLKGAEIPLAARIVAVADVYDALTSSKGYKPVFSPETAYSMIIQESGGHFDPAVVEAFTAREDDFLQVCRLTQAEAESAPIK